MLSNKGLQLANAMRCGDVGHGLDVGQTLLDALRTTMQVLQGRGGSGYPQRSKCKMLRSWRIGLGCIRNTVGHHDAPTHKGRHATTWPWSKDNFASIRGMRA